MSDEDENQDHILTRTQRWNKFCADRKASLPASYTEDEQRCSLQRQMKQEQQLNHLYGAIDPFCPEIRYETLLIECSKPTLGRRYHCGLKHSVNLSGNTRTERNYICGCIAGRLTSNLSVDDFGFVSGRLEWKRDDAAVGTEWIQEADHRLSSAWKSMPAEWHRSFARKGKRLDPDCLSWVSMDKSHGTAFPVRMSFSGDRVRVPIVDVFELAVADLADLHPGTEVTATIVINGIFVSDAPMISLSNDATVQLEAGAVQQCVRLQIGFRTSDEMGIWMSERNLLGCHVPQPIWPIVFGYTRPFDPSAESERMWRKIEKLIWNSKSSFWSGQAASGHTGTVGVLNEDCILLQRAVADMASVRGDIALLGDKLTSALFFPMRFLQDADMFPTSHELVQQFCTDGARKKHFAINVHLRREAILPSIKRKVDEQDETPTTWALELIVYSITRDQAARRIKMKRESTLIYTQTSADTFSVSVAQFYEPPVSFPSVEYQVMLAQTQAVLSFASLVVGINSRWSLARLRDL